ncbi:MAG: SPOR domain-containing protein [Phycisphaerae bacterium]
MQCALTSGRLILIRLVAFVLAALLLLALASGCAQSRRADRAVFDSGYAAFQAGRWSRAVTDFSRYLRMDPDSPDRGEVYYYRGQALVHLERRPEAKADFLRAIGADARPPIDQFARVALGNLYYEECDDVEAVKQYAAVLANPHEEVPVPHLLLRTGVALQRLGQWEKGRRYLEYLMVHHSDSAAARQAARYAAADAFRVQTGAFSAKASAAAQARKVRQAGFTPRLAKVTSSGRRLTAVQVGRERTYSDAATLAQRLRRAGFNTLIVP